MKNWRQWVVSIPVFRSLIFYLELGRSRKILKDIEPWLGKGEVLDVGTGSGVLGHLIRNSGRKIQALDLQDLTVTDEIKPIIYDGKNMPFGVNQFETALILYVLHHAVEPDKVLSEAARNAQRVIVLEDVITGRWNAWITKFLDSLVNLEFFGHPHSNRRHEEWMASFKEMGLQCVDSQDVESSLLIVKPMNHKMYILNTENYHGSE